MNSNLLKEIKEKLENSESDIEMTISFKELQTLNEQVKKEAEYQGVEAKEHPEEIMSITEGFRTAKIFVEGNDMWFCRIKIRI